MGKSSKEGKDVILDWVRDLELAAVLDIGAGSGTYRKLFIKNKVPCIASWTAIEAWEPYIQKFNLTDLYNTVINQDIRQVDFSSIGPVDLTFMGDVLEHVTKQESINIVKHVMTISKYAVISIPIVHWPQHDLHGNPFEVHVKDDWSDLEVKETFAQYITKSWAGEKIGVYWLESQ